MTISKNKISYLYCLDIVRIGICLIYLQIKISSFHTIDHKNITVSMYFALFFSFPFCIQHDNAPHPLICDICTRRMQHVNAALSHKRKNKSADIWLDITECTCNRKGIVNNMWRCFVIIQCICWMFWRVCIHFFGRTIKHLKYIYIGAFNAVELL